MEFTIEVDPESGLGKFTVLGDIRRAELPDLFSAAWSDSAYSKVEKAIWNFLNTRSTMSLEDLMRLTNWIATHKQGRGAKTIAIVASSDVVFRDEHAATAWLQAQP